MRPYFITILLCTMLSQTGWSQEAGSEMADGYYLTVGVYAASKEYYAIRYTNLLQGEGFDAAYGFSPSRNYYYVYLTYTNSYREAIRDMRDTRSQGRFPDAWVYVLSPAVRQVTFTEEEQKQIKKTDEVLEKKVVGGLGEMFAARFENDSTKAEEPEEEKTEEVKQQVQIKTPKPQALKNTQLKLNVKLFNARNKAPVDGEVQIVDAERAQLLDVIEANTYERIVDPGNRTGKLLLVVDNFGFRKAQVPFNYYSPDTTINSIYKSKEGYNIELDLIRYYKGDLVVMYNVYFFKDANLMLPESRYELNSLLEMMKENPNYQIRIHGHTNGNASGPIILKDESPEYFALTEGNEEGYGSAKSLSKARAEVIMEWLIENGIDENRLSIKAWGGKRPIYEKLSNLAKGNVRVEIEILED